jgi:hypothetical protein
MSWGQEKPPSLVQGLALLFAILLLVARISCQQDPNVAVNAICETKGLRPGSRTPGWFFDDFNCGGPLKKHKVKLKMD